MNKALYVMLIFIASVITVISCSKDGTSGGGGGGNNTLNCNTITNKSFAADVNPIIQSFCNQAGCHGSGSSNGPGALTNYTQVAANAGTIRSAISTGRMPQGSTLSGGQKASIICWIDSRAPNN